MKYKWLLIDIDSTLFDYDKAEEDALRKTFERLNLEYDESVLGVYRQINNKIWSDFEKGKITPKQIKVRRFPMLFEKLNIDSDPKAFNDIFLRNLSEGLHLIEGAEEVLKALNEKFKIALITNGLKDVQRPRITKSAIFKYISRIIISEEVGVSKPDKKIFDIAFQRMNYPDRQEVLMIGDNLTSDIKGGNDYGIGTCWFNPKKVSCDSDLQIKYEIEKLTELLNILEVE
jgi:YjjG family noncanonical pyrimidine nucleotidase